MTSWLDRLRATAEKGTWRPIPGYDDRYEASDLGHVRTATKRWKGGPRILKPNLTPDGYLRVGIGGRTVSVHRLVALAHVDGAHPDLQVNHKDGNKLNNVAANLEWVSQAGNLEHARANGMFPRGEDMPDSVLTFGDVVAIRARAASDLKCTIRGLAREYGVSKTTIKKVIWRQTWQHIEGGGTDG